MLGLILRIVSMLLNVFIKLQSDNVHFRIKYKLINIDQFIENIIILQSLFSITVEGYTQAASSFELQEQSFIRKLGLLLSLLNFFFIFF